MYFGFNTNGLAHHAFEDAVSLLSQIGYEGIAITLDHDLLARRDGDFFWRVPLAELQETVRCSGLRSVVETGARFLLDPWKKHVPNLLDPAPAQRALRQKFYARAVELAQALGSDCVSIWSGTPLASELETVLMARLVEELKKLVDFAGERGVKIAFEPEPGMFIATMDQFERLLDSAPEKLRLTLDVGHLFCQNEPIPFYVQRHAGRLVNIHFDDARRGVHEHLFPGEGEVDFEEFFSALRTISYSGGVFAELSRHSATGAETAQKVFAFLTKFKD
ncbi:MAG: sugar phosphate isomerase/epimerase [Thermoguttaceae bacterium]|nr:sugar phosphate isomerase/epimerase [Thermoguttaceae bacterium]